MAKQETQKQDTSHIRISAKVSEKGGVCIYGLRKFPITLYRDELSAILDREAALRKFMEDNASKLSVKSAVGGPEGAVPL